MKRNDHPIHRLRALGSACCLLGVGVLISPAASASVTNTITSAPFSIGLGYTSSQTWNDSETSAYNTPTTQGNFSFVPTVVSRLNSASGVYFTNRVITSQVGTDFGWSGNGGVANPSTQSAYTNTITASWLGGIPADTLTNPEINPNFRIQLNITSLRLWVSNYDGTGNPFGFVEITPGHGSSSPTITDSPTAGGAQNAPTYTQLVWDPADFTESGMASTRSFVLTAPNVADLQIDGYEVLGNVQFFYEVPEPTIAALLAMSGLLLLRARRV